MKNYFSIGNMSKLFNVSIQTLRYYDKIELFKPSHTDSSSNYRYYSLEQFIYLDIIKYLKYLGTSLDEIKNIIQYKNSIDDLTAILTEKEKTIDEQIRKLKDLKGLINDKISQLKQTSSASILGDVSMQHFDESEAIALDLDCPTQDDYLISLRKTMSRIEEVSYSPDRDLGFMCSYSEYQQSRKVKYQKMFLDVNPVISAAVKEGSLIKIPSGDYLCILYKGLEEEAEACYAILLDYIEKNALKVSGYFYESSIIHGVATVNLFDYVMEVKILLDKS